MTSAPHVLIVGAGLTGLFVAQGLKKAGVSFTIFEAETPDDSRRKEWSMGIHWGLPLLESLLPEELSARLISDAAVDPSLDYVTPPTNGSVIYDGVTGEVMKVLQSDDKLVRASRKKLRKLISEDIDIKYNHSLTSITHNPNSTVTAHFLNSQSYTGTLLLGADGPRSLVRQTLFPSSPQTSLALNLPSNPSTTFFPELDPLPSLVQLSTTFSLPLASQALSLREQLHPVWSVMLHPELYIYLCLQDAPIDSKPEDWKFFLYICWFGERDDSLTTSAQRLNAVRERAKRAEKPIMEPYRSLVLDWIPEDAELSYIESSTWLAREWSSELGGRVTLAGDAAHPMPPFRGQGLNNALLDAVNFVNAVDWINRAGKEEGGLQERLMEEYMKEVVERGRKEAELTIRNGYMLIGYEEASRSPYFREGLRKMGEGEDGE